MEDLPEIFPDNFSGHFPDLPFLGVLVFLGLLSGPEKGVITKGVFSFEESLESLKFLDSLESLEMVGFSFLFHSLGVL